MYESELRDQLSQGDLFRDVLISEGVGEHQQSWNRRVMVLSHDCEIDKPTCTSPLVVAVRALDDFPEEHRGLIRENRLYNGMYLEPGNGIEEGFADFRFIHRMRREDLAEPKKLASLTQEAREAMPAYLWRFFTRKEPPEIPR